MPVPRWPRVRAGVAVLLFMTLAGCVGPTVVDAHYRGKAIESVEGMRGVIDAVIATVETYADGEAFTPFTTRLAVDKEEEAAWIREAFATRQPPPGHDDLRRSVLPLLEDAVAAASEVRIAVQRGRSDVAAELLPRLHDVSARLEDERRRLR